MNKTNILLTILTLFTVTNAYAIQDARDNIATEMNSAVKEIKDLFIDAKDDVNSSLDESKGNKKKAQLLYEQSKEEEVNPTVLDHAKKSIEACNYDTENLQWKNNKWDCVKAKASQDCIAAPDEYRYKDSKGNWVCTKHPSGGKLNYYYQFRGYSNKCTGAHTGYEKLYDCVYKNKLGQIIQVEDKLCSGKSKPTVANKICPKSWTVGSWGSCNKTCGGGTQYRTVTCQAGYDCSGSPKPTTSQSCNTQKCKGQWTIGPWSKCSATVCETRGTQTRSVTCAAHLDCSGAKKPTTSQACSAPSCSYGWRWGSWSSCNKTCGGGTQTRTVRCANLSHSSLPTVADSKCKGTKPATSQKCNTQTCVTYSWHIGAWKGCNKTCGGGTNTRDVYCKSSTGAKVSDSYCSNKGTKPSATASCNTQACITYSWYIGTWGSCSKSCGTGYKNRTVYCKSSAGARVSDGYCKSTKPATSTSCNTQTCVTYSWITGSWGKCSKSCGSGTQSRSVYCKANPGSKVSDGYCKTSKPKSSQSCNTQSCEPDCSHCYNTASRDQFEKCMNKCKYGDDYYGY
jgi:hypothetical protein